MSVAYSPDGRHIASGSNDTTIRIWDVETGAMVGEPLKGHTREIVSVAYSPDSRYVVSGSWDNTIRVWNATTGVQIGDSLKGHTNLITSLAYSPDCRHIASVSFDNTIRVWDVGAMALVDDQYVVSDKPTIWEPKIPENPVTVDFHPDESGWVRHSEGGLLFWLPEDCRNGLTCPAILTIPTDGSSRVVRLDTSSACFGTSWEQIK
ncbi:POC1 centriolar protein A [Serendipita sp. 411]|nr:POC1 centriolar protein A [Serendipita sp. 411]